jgi:hypothetical protein
MLPEFSFPTVMNGMRILLPFVVKIRQAVKLSFRSRFAFLWDELRRTLGANFVSYSMKT